MTSIYGMVYNELKAKIEHLKGYKQYETVFDALDREAFGDIILDGNTVWIEPSYSEVTDRQYNLLIKYLKSKGYNYLYDKTRA